MKFLHSPFTLGSPYDIAYLVLKSSQVFASPLCKILHSHSTPKGAPACAMASKSYGWDVRNIAKISPKMAKKQPFFDFIRFSQKLSIRFEPNFLQLFYTILESYMCNDIKIVWLGCEKQPKLTQKWSKKGHFSTSEGKRPQPTPLPHMRLWLSIYLSRYNFPFITEDLLDSAVALSLQVMVPCLDTISSDLGFSPGCAE